MKKKVFNVMFTKRLGGIEQSFLDYNECLKEKYDVVALINSECKVKNHITSGIEEIKQFNKYDPFAILRIRRAIKKHNPAIIIAHSTRAFVLCNLATKSIPIIAVSHNHNFKHLSRSKFIIAITNIMKKELQEKSKAHVFTLPNMIKLEKDLKYSPPKFHKTVSIGFIGTLNYTKGVDLLLEAASEIIKNGYKIKLLIAGEGEESDNLKKQAAALNLTTHVEFLGWVKDKAKENFFKKIDLLCMPSRSESFCIVFLEAMKYSKPLVTTRTNGSLEVANNVAVFTDTNSHSIAQEIIKLITKPIIATKMAEKGFKEIYKYSQEKIARKLQKIVREVIVAHENI